MLKRGRPAKIRPAKIRSAKLPRIKTSLERGRPRKRNDGIKRIKSEDESREKKLESKKRLENEESKKRLENERRKEIYSFWSVRKSEANIILAPKTLDDENNIESIEESMLSKFWEIIPYNVDDNFISTMVHIWRNSILYPHWIKRALDCSNIINASKEEIDFYILQPLLILFIPDLVSIIWTYIQIPGDACIWNADMIIMISKIVEHMYAQSTYESSAGGYAADTLTTFLLKLLEKKIIQEKEKGIVAQC